MSQYHCCLSSVIRSCVIFVHIWKSQVMNHSDYFYFMIPGQSPVGNEGGAGDEQGHGGEKGRWPPGDAEGQWE